MLISVVLICEQAVFAQTAGPVMPEVSAVNHSIPGVFSPARLRSVDFGLSGRSISIVLDKGTTADISSDNLASSCRELVEYFLTGIRLPNSSLWVNLRPGEQNNTIDDLLSKTDVGGIMLQADVQLKKDLAACTSPRTPRGRQYWDKLYAKAEQLYAGEDATIPTITRPWIVPGEIILRQTSTGAYIYKATLKVMLEQDYIGSFNQIRGASNDLSVPAGGTIPSGHISDPRLKELNEYSTKLIRELIIPGLSKEINSSKKYARLRQVYYSLILAQWVKSRKDGFHAIAGQCDSKDLMGLISGQAQDKNEYYRAYEKSFKDGEYDIEETAAARDGLTVRRYFSGGIAFGAIDAVSISVINARGRFIPSAGYAAGFSVIFSKDGGIFSVEYNAGAPAFGGVSTVIESLPKGAPDPLIKDRPLSGNRFLSPDVFEQDVEQGILGGNIDISADIPWDNHSPVVLGLRETNTRGLSRAGRQIIERLLRDSAAETEVLVLGPGAGVECSQIYELASAFGKPAAIDTIGLTPISPRLRLKRNIQDIRSMALDYFLNGGKALHGTAEYYKFLTNSYPESVEDLVPSNMAGLINQHDNKLSVPLAFAMGLQNSGYDIYSDSGATFIRKQFITTLSQARLQRRYDFIYDDFGAFYYTAANEPLGDVLRGVSSLLKEDGIFYAEHLYWDEIIPGEIFNLDNELVFVKIGVSKSQGLSVLMIKKNGILAEKARPYIREDLVIAGNIYRVQDMEELAGALLAKDGGRREDISGLGDLVTRIADPDYETGTRYLNSFLNSPDERAAEALIRALSADDPFIRGNVIRALSALGAKGLEKVFLDHLQDSSWHVRRMSVLALEKFDSEAALNGIVNALSDHDRNVVLTAIKALSGRNSRDISAKLEKLADNDDREIRVAALDALIKPKDPSVIDALIRKYRYNFDEDRKAEILTALAYFRDERVFGILYDALNDRTVDLVENAARALDSYSAKDIAYYLICLARGKKIGFISDDQIEMLESFDEARRIVETSLLAEPGKLPYSGDYLQLTIETIKMLEAGLEKGTIDTNLRSRAGELRATAELYPSIGVEIEVWDDFIKTRDRYFSREQASVLSAALGINIDDDGRVEFSLPPTTEYQGQIEIIDFMRRFGLIPPGFFPVHVNLGLMSDYFMAESHALEAVKYYGYPLAFIYSPDIRLMGANIAYYNNYQEVVYHTSSAGSRIDVENVKARFEIRALSLTTDDDPGHRGSMYLPDDPYGAFSMILRDAQSLGILIRNIRPGSTEADAFKEIRSSHERRMDEFYASVGLTEELLQVKPDHKTMAAFVDLRSRFNYQQRLFSLLCASRNQIMSMPRDPVETSLKDGGYARFAQAGRASIVDEKLLQLDLKAAHARGDIVGDSAPWEKPAITRDAYSYRDGINNTNSRRLSEHGRNILKGLLSASSGGFRSLVLGAGAGLEAGDIYDMTSAVKKEAYIDTVSLTALPANLRFMKSYAELRELVYRKIMSERETLSWLEPHYGKLTGSTYSKGLLSGEIINLIDHARSSSVALDLVFHLHNTGTEELVKFYPRPYIRKQFIGDFKETDFGSEKYDFIYDDFGAFWYTVVRSAPPDFDRAIKTVLPLLAGEGVFYAQYAGVVGDRSISDLYPGYVICVKKGPAGSLIVLRKNSSIARNLAPFLKYASVLPNGVYVLNENSFEAMVRHGFKRDGGSEDRADAFFSKIKDKIKDSWDKRSAPGLSYEKAGHRMTFLPTAGISEDILPAGYSTANGLRPVGKTIRPLPASIDDIPRVEAVPETIDGKYIVPSSALFNGTRGVVLLARLAGTSYPVVMKTNPGYGWMTLPEYRGFQLADDLGIGPKVHGVAEFESKLWVVMDLVPGDLMASQTASVNEQTIIDFEEIHSRISSNGINPGADLQFMVSPSGRLWVIDAFEMVSSFGQKSAAYDHYTRQDREFLHSRVESSGRRKALADRFDLPVTPAKTITDIFGLDSPAVSTGIEPQDIQAHNGYKVRRVDISRGSPPSTLASLTKELFLMKDFTLHHLDMLFRPDGKLIAVFPVLTKEMAGHYRLKSGQTPAVRYLNLAYYHYILPQPGQDPSGKIWNEIIAQLSKDMAAVYGYLDQRPDSRPEQINPDESPYVYVEIDTSGHIIKTKQLLEVYRDRFIPRFEDLSKEPAPGVMSAVLTVFPTVYSPATHADIDRDYYTRLIRDFDLARDKSVLVVGPGAGLEAWIAARKTGSRVFSIGINPMEVANLKHTAATLGFGVTAIQGDNIISDIGEPRFPDIRFDRLIWNMPQYVSEYDTEVKRNQTGRLDAHWDGDYGGKILERFNKGLPEVLKPGGQAIVWNVRSLVPSWDFNKIDRVEEVFRSSGKLDVKSFHYSAWDCDTYMLTYMKDGGTPGPGGIDFRTMPARETVITEAGFIKKYQPTALVGREDDTSDPGNYPGAVEQTLSVAELCRYAAESYKNNNITVRKQRVISRVCDMLRVEEDNNLPSDPAVKDLLAFLESF